MLIGLGLEERLAAAVVAPATIRSGRGSVLTRIPLGGHALARYGAPYWVAHRADLQATLLDAARTSPDIVLRLGTRIDDFVVHGHGVSVSS